MRSSNCPILVIFFNRPSIFYQQLAALKVLKPTCLFFAADGARRSSRDDIQNLIKCKEMISQLVDWDCKLQYFYSAKNCGCDQFVPMAIDWFFMNVESGIILEDDCLISMEFYSFASRLLNKYATDERVMNISAPNFQQKKWGDGDYYFSRYPANWAWATWRRAWRYYDPKIQDLDQFIGPDGQFNHIQLDPKERRYWLKFFRGLQGGKYTFWDAKWLYSIWNRDGVSITPNFNLSTNIGYGETATHTKELTQTHAMPIYSIGNLDKDPGSMEIQTAADHYLYLNFYKPKIKDLLSSLINKMKQFYQ